MVYPAALCSTANRLLPRCLAHTKVPWKNT